MCCERTFTLQLSHVTFFLLYFLLENYYPHLHGRRNREVWGTLSPHLWDPGGTEGEQ